MGVWFAMARYFLEKQKKEREGSWKCQKCGKKGKPEQLKKQGSVSLRCRSCGYSTSKPVS